MVSLHPRPQAHPAPRSAEGRPVYTYGLMEVTARLGQEGRSTRWLVAYIGRLIGAHGFPAPLPLQLGEQLRTDVCPRSRWSAAAVDAWFDSQLPPGAAGIDAAAERAAADDMDARAFAFGPLRMIDGGRA
jgi:hypothetical protein